MWKSVWILALVVNNKKKERPAGWFLRELRVDKEVDNFKAVVDKWISL